MVLEPCRWRACLGCYWAAVCLVGGGRVWKGKTKHYVILHGTGVGPGVCWVVLVPTGWPCVNKRLAETEDDIGSLPVLEPIAESHH